MKVIKVLSVDIPGLGHRIKTARENDPRTLKKICEEVGMSAQNWYRLEDEKQTLTIETLRKIEEVLNVSFNVNIDD